MKTNRAKVLKEYPLPTVEVVPLSSDTSLKQFLDQFKTLHQVRIDLIKPNDEIDSAGLLKKMREAGNALGATDSALIYRTSGAEKSLSHAKALKGLKPIVSEGNAKVTLSGKDRHGDTLTGNNESFKMGIPIADVSTNPRGCARSIRRIPREGERWLAQSSGRRAECSREDQETSQPGREVRWRKLKAKSFCAKKIWWTFTGPQDRYR
ncbi:MAG: hypothetical protein IPG13_05835 [Rhodocyclaceae bacterium]|nr:hypothetical protein [Rhodocyclaceae bacterium]